jgi:hypothetical protein
MFQYGVKYYHTASDCSDTHVLFDAFAELIHSGYAKIRFSALASNSTRWSKSVLASDETLAELQVNLRSGLYTGLVAKASARYLPKIEVVYSGRSMFQRNACRIELSLIANVFEDSDLRWLRNLASSIWAPSSLSYAFSAVSCKADWVSMELSGVSYLRADAPMHFTHQRRLDAVQRCYACYPPAARLVAWEHFLNAEQLKMIGGADEIRRCLPGSDVVSVEHGGAVFALDSSPVFIEDFAPHETAVRSLLAPLLRLAV